MIVFAVFAVGTHPRAALEPANSSNYHFSTVKYPVFQRRTQIEFAYFLTVAVTQSSSSTRCIPHAAANSTLTLSTFVQLVPHGQSNRQLSLSLCRKQMLNIY